VRSFGLGNIKLGDIEINIPSGRFSFDGQFDFVKSKGFVLSVSAGIDAARRLATWTFSAVVLSKSGLFSILNIIYDRF
jgi:hypothetical protein